MNYLYAEHLKWKHTISNQLIWIAPLFTAAFAWLMGGFYGNQYMSFYWWYTFLLPGTIAILCALSVKKERKNGNYNSLFSMAVDLKWVAFAKSGVVIEKMLLAAVMLAIFASVNHLMAPSLVVYSVWEGLIGSVGIILASLWQVPLCFWLARKAGMLLPVVMNVLFSIILPVTVGNTAFGMVFPYYWPARVAKGLLGIEINGTFTGMMTEPMEVVVVMMAAFVLFVVLAFFDALDFAKGEKQ